MWSDKESDQDETASGQEQPACCESGGCQHESAAEHEHASGSSAKRQKTEAVPDSTAETAHTHDMPQNASTSTTAQHADMNEAAITATSGLDAAASKTQAASQPPDGVEDGTEVSGHDGMDAAYIMAFLDRHVCPQELPASVAAEFSMCGGTMAPSQPDSDVYECNMCGYNRRESERIAELEQTYLQVQAEAA